MKFRGAIFIRFLLWPAILCLSLAAFSQSTLAAGPSDAECEAFAHDLEAKFAARDLAAVNAAIDVDAILDRSLAGVNVPKEIRENLHAGFVRGFSTSLNRAYDGFQGFHLLQVRRDKGEPRLLFRIITKSGGFNYHEMIVERTYEGKLRVADVFVYLTGELLSETFKRLLIPILEDGQKSIVEKFFSDQPDILKYEPQWRQMTACNQRKEFAKTLEINAQLPQALQQQKFILALRLQAAQAVGDKEYLQTLDLWRDTYPDDPSVNLISIDAFILHKQYAAALGAVDRLDKALGGDPYMNIQRAAISQMMKEYGQAAEYAHQVLLQEPALLTGFEFPLSLFIVERKYSDAVRLLDEIAKKPGTTKAVLVDQIQYDSHYVQFVRSPEFRTWAAIAAPAPAATPPAEAVPAVPAPAPVPVPSLKLQGIFYKPTSASATINGKYVMTGDSVAGCKVLTIEKESVTLQGPDGQKITLNMK